VQDLNGLAVSTSSAAAADAFNHALRAYLGNRADAADHLGAALAADPEFGLAHCLKGCFMMLAYNAGYVPMAMASARLATRLDARERKHAAALTAWAGGDGDGAFRRWEEILDQHPADVLALRLSHFNYFWNGRREDMLRSVQRVASHTDERLPTYGITMSCLAFGLEENGEYAAAERAGRRAVELDPADGWGTHAVAHVMEMQKRPREGLEFLGALESHWAPMNNFVHHLWWHRAMFHIQLGEHDAVLDLYDRRFRSVGSPLVQKMPDLYIDIQNAASMLMRLELRGVDVGGRWVEIADKAEARIGDCLSMFTLPHWAMALAAAGRESATRRFLEAVGASTSRVVREVALPACRAVVAHRRGDFAKTVELMQPLLPRLGQLGGSHAQRDVLVQILHDAEKRA
jgi:tetratricopeptide (TPR) repeat protein